MSIPDREIHFYVDRDDIPDHIRYHSDLVGTKYAMYETNEPKIHTTQLLLLDTILLRDGFRIIMHDVLNDTYEIKLGKDNERTNRNIKIGHDLLKLWRNGEFAKEDEI